MGWWGGGGGGALHDDTVCPLGTTARRSDPSRHNTCWDITIRHGASRAFSVGGPGAVVPRAERAARPPDSGYRPCSDPRGGLF